MAAIYTAFGLTQFAPVLPTSGPPPNQQLIVSHTTPFGARLDIEIINAPQPVAANRTESSNAYTAGPPTSYIHFIISQRTLPLGASFAACGQRTDGWCELQTFIQIQSQSLKNASYDYSCSESSLSIQAKFHSHLDECGNKIQEPSEYTSPTSPMMD